MLTIPFATRPRADHALRGLVASSPLMLTTEIMPTEMPQVGDVIRDDAGRPVARVTAVHQDEAQMIMLNPQTMRDIMVWGRDEIDEATREEIMRDTQVGEPTPPPAIAGGITRASLAAALQLMRDGHARH